jgi:hypothetical protein
MSPSENVVIWDGTHINISLLTGEESITISGTLRFASYLEFRTMDKL